MNIRVTKIFEFEAAHALDCHDGKCSNIHGHSYKLHVTVIGTPNHSKGDPKDGMVIDFSDIKRIVKTMVVGPFDHALVLEKDSPYLTEELKERQKLILYDIQPTAENMIIDMVNRINSKIPKGIQLHNVKLYETASSFAAWFREDNK
jgi:6-pyruvoyltetrahydropterin/6-carboxytetrahydropterin synthase